MNICLFKTIINIIKIYMSEFKYTTYHIKDCPISEDIIKYKYKEIIDSHNIDKKYIFKDVYDIYNNFGYIITYNSRIIGYYNHYNNDYKDLLLCLNCDWYKAINILRRVIDEENDVLFHCVNGIVVDDSDDENYDKNYEVIHLSFDKIMCQYAIINDILDYFGYIQKYIDKKSESLYFLIPCKKYIDTFRDSLKINIVGYDDYDRKNKIFDYMSKIKIYQYIDEDFRSHYCDDSLYKKITLNKKNKNNKNNKKHENYIYQIIFDEPLLFASEKNEFDIQISIDILFNNKVIPMGMNSINRNIDFKLNDFLINQRYVYDCTYYIDTLICEKYICNCIICEEIKIQYNIKKSCFCNNSQKLLFNEIEKIDSRHKTKLQKNRHMFEKFIYYEIEKPYIFNIYYNTNIFDTKFENNGNIDENENEYDNLHSYIYLIEKFDLNKNKSIYKFGKSKRPIHNRLKEHGQEAKILLILHLEDCDMVEKNILKILKNDKNIKKEHGNEYFSYDDKYYIIDKIIKNINI